MTRLARVLAAIVVAAVVSACSPEASRTRGDGPGADVGNHSRALPQPSTPPASPG